MRFKDITARFHRQPPAKPITTPKPVEKQLAQFEPLLDEPNRIEKHKLTVRTRQADGEQSENRFSNISKKERYPSFTFLAI